MITVAQARGLVINRRPGPRGTCDDWLICTGAGFAATREEIQRDLRDGPEASIDRFLNGQAQATGVKQDHEAVANRLGDAAVASSDPDRLKAWWVLRMLVSPDPLRERLTLMWHNHFATSNQKVNDLAAMQPPKRALATTRSLAFRRASRSAVRAIPALLAWLDAPANRKGHPNENLARELMELFTLGIGHYGEDDVKEAARALTGWTVYQGAFLDNLPAHDQDPKTVLGKSGRWNGADLTRILLEHPATAHRLATRLCETFLGERAVSTAAISELADGLRTHSLDIGWAVATILRSRAFFAAASMGSRVSGPVEFVVGAVRALECLDPLPSTLCLAQWITQVGQDLFYPANVGGWPGGRAWLSTRGMIARSNFATALVSGRKLGLAEPADVVRLIGHDGGTASLESIVQVLSERLTEADPGGAWRQTVVAAARDGHLELQECAPAPPRSFCLRPRPSSLDPYFSPKELRHAFSTRFLQGLITRRFALGLCPRGARIPGRDRAQPRPSARAGCWS